MTVNTLPAPPTPPAIHAPAPEGLRDDGYGACPAFSHYHKLMGVGSSTGGDEHPDPPVKIWLDGYWVTMDGLCHDDDTDEPVKARQVLPVPGKSL